MGPAISAGSKMKEAEETLKEKETLVMFTKTTRTTWSFGDSEVGETIS